MEMKTELAELKQGKTKNLLTDLRKKTGRSRKTANIKNNLHVCRIITHMEENSDIIEDIALFCCIERFRFKSV